MAIHLLKPTTALLSLAAVLLIAPTVNGVQAAADIFNSNLPVTLAANVTVDEETQRRHKETNSADAYDAFLEGWTRYRQYTPEDFAKAIPDFQRAIQLDPNYGRAHAALALVYAESWLNDWSTRVGIGWHVDIQEANRHLKAAMKAPTPPAHRAASLMFTMGYQYEEVFTSFLTVGAFTDRFASPP